MREKKKILYSNQRIRVYVKLVLNHINHALSVTSFSMCVCCHSYHSAIVDVLPQKVAVVECPFGFSCHSVHWPFVHLILYGSVEHVERLARHLLTDRQVQVKVRQAAR